MPEAEPNHQPPAGVMTDPSAVAVARVYAEAFLNAAGPLADDALEEFSSFIDDVLQQNPPFASILTTAYLGREEKRELIDRVLGKFASEQFTNFLRVLARHERLDLLPLILQQSRIQHELRQGKRRVGLRTAVALDEAALEAIRRRLAERFSFQPVLMPIVDESLLGGIVVQVGDTVYDGSLRSRIKQLRSRIGQRSLYEIQSGRDRFSHPEGD